MAQRDSQRIGRVIGLRKTFELQDFLHHDLHLFLFGASVTGQSLLDLQRSIFKYANTIFLKCQEYGTSGLADFHHRFYVLKEEQILHGRLVWLIFFNNFLQIPHHLKKPFSGGIFWRGRDVSIGHGAHLALHFIQNRPADNRRAGIDT
jgi:hypothetical protein